MQKGLLIVISGASGTGKATFKKLTNSGRDLTPDNFNFIAAPERSAALR